MLPHAPRRVLVIEDDADLQKTLTYNLRNAGYEVLTARDGREGLARAQDSLPDLLLLDLMLPSLGGNEICAVLRENKATRNMPIMMLTARGKADDRIRGLQDGADDYVVKPFSLRELMLRIEALLRRSARTLSATQHGCLSIDLPGHQIEVAGRPVELTRLEFDLLTTLFHRRGRVQSRERLLDAVWGRDAPVTLRTVDTHLQRLREKLGPASAYIETVRGVGYRFVRGEETP